MRDYSFGNFISALRERRGLSQYQLGALVGVSDKAVSKWENGASKPRTDTMRKLAKELEISVDELLTCEYDTFEYERKDLFAMKNNIIKLAEEKMKFLYGDTLPIRIVNRFKTEKMMLEGHEILLWMGFLGKLREEACANHIYFEVRGAQMGASLIAWLLGATNVNPLPAHYYCSQCKKIEFVSDTKCGVDLPDKKCSCGSDLEKDGFGIDVANMYPLSKECEIRISNNAIEKVKDWMREYFAGYGEVVELQSIYEDGAEYQNTEQIRLAKLMLISKEKAKKYPGKVVTLTVEEYVDFRRDLPILTIIEDSEEKLELSDLQKLDFTTGLIREYYGYARDNGKFDDVTGNSDLNKLLSSMTTPSFSELIAITGMQYSTGAWEENAELLFAEGKPLLELIFCREDVYDKIFSALGNCCCDNPMGQAFEIKEQVRKGLYSRRRMPEAVEMLLKECNVPDWYIQSMKKLKYLFPKTYLIMLLKREICKFAIGKSR